MSDTLHPHETFITLPLVKRLLGGQFTQWTDLSLEQISSGSDHRIFRLGHNKIIRLPRIKTAEVSLCKEIQWLSYLAPFVPLTIPQPVATGIPTRYYPYHWGIYQWIEGTHPTVGSVPQPKSFIHDMVNFLNALHSIEPSNGPYSSRGGPLVTQDQAIRGALGKIQGLIDTSTLLSIWEKTLDAPPWQKAPQWIHADLSPMNILIQKDALSSVIDFGLTGLGDPACDFIIAWNLFGPEERRLFRTALSIDEATWRRALGWALSIAALQWPYYAQTHKLLAQNASYTLHQILLDHKASSL